MRRYPASRYPIAIGRGADFEKVWIFYPQGVGTAPKDWTGCTASAQLRSSAWDADDLLTFTTTLGSDGSVRMAADHTETSVLPSGEAVWDLYVTHPDGEVERFMGGSATISQQVTRP